MLFGELSYLGHVVAPRDRPFEGDAAVPAQEAPDAGLLFTLYLFPELSEWQPLLRRLAIPLDRAAAFAALARKNGTDFQSEFLISGEVDEDEFYRALAEELGLGYASSLEPERLIVADAIAAAFLRRRTWHIPVKIAERGGATSYLIAPEQMGLDRLREMVDRRPVIARHLKITAPKTLRAALFSRVRPMLAKAAVSDLFDRFPDLSARIVVNAWQGAVAGAAIIAFPVALSVAPAATWMTLHFFFTFFFLACVALRFAAVTTALPQRPAPVEPVDNAELPVYSVLVALYREAEIVPELVEALDRIVWPKSKIEIKLVCEADDLETLNALRATPLPRSMEVIEVPVFGPRTKPKALAYALPLVSGELVALYDAEDHPHPQQLIQAWQAFRRSEPDLACVQAPLEISNRGEGPVSLMFAFEYAALFRGLLPWLSHRRMLLPLGGTSNHFRRSVLEDICGWDPHNVTEDADLGLRLVRFGYRTETIACPTFEAGPDRLSTWLPQRTRWFKGWLMTWLVHMRDPLRLVRDLGFRSFLIAQILFAGMVLSALAHPLLVATAVVLAVDLVQNRPTGVWRSALFAVDVTNIACGYLSFLLLGWQTLERPERKSFWKIVLFTPIYWMMMSLAAWRAVWHLWRKPHLWEKTPHSRSQSTRDLPGTADAYRNLGPSPMIFGSGLPIASRSRPA